MLDGYAPTGKEIVKIYTIMMLYAQQKYMYENRTHHVGHRIVSLGQPWLNPIFRRKVNAPVEFGVKLDISLDAKGYAHIEKVSFEHYSESGCLEEAVEWYRPLSRACACGPDIPDTWGTGRTANSTGYVCPG